MPRAGKAGYAKLALPAWGSPLLQVGSNEGLGLAFNGCLLLQWFAMGKER